MFRRVIVGVDGGSGGREALALAGVLGADADEIFAVHVFPCERHASHRSSASHEQASREEARVLVERELVATGLAATPVASGDVDIAAGIERIAHREDADLIVLGSSRRGPIGRLLGGQVALDVIRRAGAAVAVSPKRYAGEPRHPMRVLVAFDGSPEALAALALARRLAEELGASVHALWAVEPPGAFGVTSAYGFDWTEITRRCRAECRQALTEVRGDDDRGSATSEITIGLPGQVLADASRAADLLVTGSRARGAARRLLLGSTSGLLTHTASCPLLVLPRSAIEPDAGSDVLLESSSGR